MLLKKMIPFLGLTALMACNNSMKTASGDTRDEAVEKTKPGAASDASASNGSKGSDITVTITGGAHAGVYKVHSEESTCSLGLTGDKSYGNQYSEKNKKANEVSSVQATVDDYEAAKNGTDAFTVQVGLGDLLRGDQYGLNPKDGSGTGKATVTESGSGRTVTIDGKTKEGVGLNVVITCHTINKMVNGELKEE